ncbi:DUF6496 domain-containing protein [Cytophaga hutchinsonii]|uniref:Histone H1-like protein n=1 Tax=Cytophaga hutchinsonii (strain ATCC 33406 / DSM 1761 / CIP 103989 / NBRC 15051 / NCIMB 9469 / D465) TaxID=269798 RepID=A0A6N4STK5_CYTH3|nr:DUF6496 domain-containing protein [Cytophaga hutchinsonii]ABG59554.1 hypothetical protein CHU_2293 [Cytophaga hutchinsonii ATCC 33406]SFX95384.1 hypothetical protein SAMN04487930_11469 [Cytophaga hutchinsonii ATCC 33406]
MAKYSKKAQEYVASAMDRMKKGTLRSGGSGDKVKNSKQAVAIGLSEAREKGAKVPVKKSVAKKSAAKKSTAKKAASKKPAMKKAMAKKAAPKKKVSAKKSVEKKTPMKNQR